MARAADVHADVTGTNGLAIDAATIALEEATVFAGRDDGRLELGPGIYRISPAADGAMELTAIDPPGAPSERPRTYVVRAATGVHELGLKAPIALAARDDNGQHVVVAFPGGGMLEAVTHRATARSETTMKLVGSQALVEAVIKWLSPNSPGPVTDLLYDRKELLSPGILLWADIEPGTPSGFGPSAVPPNWIGATVATCYPPPKGSIGPRGPGTETGIPPFPPGISVIRVVHPAYLIATAPVTAVSSLLRPGGVVDLVVTSHVVTLGYPTIVSMTWTDVYRMVLQTTGTVTFPGIIVATGRVPTSPPPPASSWAQEVAKFMTYQPRGSKGAPVVFELQVSGISAATRTCHFDAMFPGSPVLRC